MLDISVYFLMNAHKTFQTLPFMAFSSVVLEIFITFIKQMI